MVYTPFGYCDGEAFNNAGREKYPSKTDCKIGQEFAELTTN